MAPLSFPVAFLPERVAQPFGGGLIDAQILTQHHSVILTLRFRRDEFFLHVDAHRRRIALERIAPTAATARACDHLAIHRHGIVRAGHAAEFARAGLAQQVHPEISGLAAPQTPGRAAAAAHQFEIPFALDQIAHAHIDAEAAAIFAGAAGIRAQRAALHQHRAFELNAFDRAVAHVPLADRDRAGLAVLERAAAPAAALDALHHETAFGLRFDAEEYDRAAEQRMVAGRRPRPHRGGERRDDGVDHQRHDDAPARHRRGKARHHDAAFRDDDLERAERALVDRIERAGERLVGDVRAGERARIQPGTTLLGAAGQVDRHCAFVDYHLGVDRYGLARGNAVLVELSFSLVDAIGELR